MSKKIFKCIIVDDTAQAVSALKKLLTRYFPEIEIVGICHAVVDAVKLIKELDPDILFLDVEMPSENGTAIFEYIDKPRFETIFTTAFPDYAATAFRLKSIDYLVKPIKPSELKEAITKVKEKYQSETADNLLSLPRINDEDKITLTTLDSIEIYRIKDILYCQAENNYTMVYAKEKKSIVSKTLGHYEAMLRQYGFFRVNRSQLVNLRHVERIEKIGAQELTLINGEKLPISGRRKKELINELGKFTLNNQ